MVNGHEKLNLAFVANLFNNHPGLEPPVESITVVEETREEKVGSNNVTRFYYFFLRCSATGSTPWE